MKQSFQKCKSHPAKSKQTFVSLSLVRQFYILAILLCFGLNRAQAQESIDLSGKWSFAIDREGKGETEKWFDRTTFSDNILLPGSMPERLKGDDVSIRTQWTGSLYDSSYYFNPYMEKYRHDGEVKLPFFLTPDKHYIGRAWYKRTVEIPKSWRGQRIILSLERPHIETTLWVNGYKIGSENSLCVPHVYDITEYARTGKQDITLCVDNRHETVNVGIDSHSITDQTQGNWNGIVGEMKLEAIPTSSIEDIQVYPDVPRRMAKVVVSIRSDKNAKGILSIKGNSFNSPEKRETGSISQPLTIEAGIHEITVNLPMGDNPYFWDEFNPALYRLYVTLETGKKNNHQKEVEFGFRDFKIQGKWFYVNGRKTMLRGTVENCDFPLTGYAPMDVESWECVFRICRNYGLNHMRFHSFCPPQAAFTAADRVGFYLQPEGPSWPNHGVKLGQGQPINKYLMDETIALNREYGNHASFCMLACGNEPAGRWVEWVTKFVHYWQKADPRHVYTGASVGGGWAWQPANEFHVKAGARGLTWSRQQPESMSDYRERIDTVKQPYVSHETGQWNCFPNFNEIRKYTGVNKAKNYEIFRDLLADNHMELQAQDFLMASGKLQALCYKHEIEKTLRTPDYAGFQLLALNDYSGQGTAIVGVLDVFFGEKGYITAPEWQQFCGPTVPLARMEKFVYTNNDTLHAAIELSHYGEEPLRNATFIYTLRTVDGKVLHSERHTINEIPIGGQFPLKQLDYSFDKLYSTPQELTLEVRLANCDNYTARQATGIDRTERNYPVKEVINEWNLWVYPATVEIAEGDVFITDTLNNQAIDVLQKGGNVLLTAAGKVCYGQDVVQYFTPTFWNTSWFKMRPPHTTGVWIDDAHPLFRNFPTSYHSDLQWWELLNRAQCIMTGDMGETFQSIVQPIDTWFINRRLSLLFEANILNGKLLMTSMDISNKLNSRPVANQLRKAILDYMNSDYFRPQQQVTTKQIQDIYTKIAPKVDSFTKDSPDELKPKIK